VGLSFCLNGFAQLNRAEIEDQYKWDLSDLYTSNDEWNTAKESLVLELSKIEEFKGTITQSAENLLAILEFNSAIYNEAIKLYIYASMNSDLDTRNMEYSGMRQELEQIFSEYSANAAFIDPEILKSDWSVIESYINKEPKLQDYKKGLNDLFRQAEHTLSEPEERILALSGMITGTPQSIYSTFVNAEMPNPEVVLNNGDTITLSTAGYGKYRASANRADRELVFETYWHNYEKYQASFGEMLYGNVKSALYQSKARNYNSSLEASLSPIDIPTDVYHSLVENVNKNLPAFHRYLTIKKRMMGVDTLRYLDLYAPTVKGVDLEYTYEQSQELILKALEPLGKEYIATVKKAFDERWIDVFPAPGKRGGAYSNGAFYDGHPYILLNYNGLYDDVGTIAHELGHTMQSYFSNKNQPFPLADYEIFVAEVASTFNEVLLFEYMIKTVEDEDARLSLLMGRLDEFKNVLFRQTQFAEFELKMHEEAQEGKPLTGEYLSEIYTDIVKRYYGHDEGICFVDDYMHMEWAFVPHFYNSFYVYQYSTSFAASNALAERVLNKEEGALEDYRTFLGAGGSDYPIELLKSAGVDMTSSEALNKTIEAMTKVMDEIEKILDKREGQNK
jgi:oligoendopeptidase F